MIWILGIGLFIVFWFVFPPFRKFVLWGGALIALMVVGVVFYYKHKEAVEKSLIPSNQVELTNLSLWKDKLSGEVKNNSDHELLDVRLEVKAFDCPLPPLPPGFTLDKRPPPPSGHNLMPVDNDPFYCSTPPPSCITIGQDSVYIWNTVPPHQVRAIDSHVSFSNLPSVKGGFCWSYEITGTRGR